MSGLDSKPIRGALQVAVVGHTNTGKTSLIRTLLRSSKFGDIANAAGTTRHVEKAAVMVGSQKIIEFFDTPGLEDSAALFDLLDKKTLDGRESLKQFVSAGESSLEQEVKVIRQALKSDVLLYVVDVRADLLEKFSDEIAVLSRLGVPIVPVFNFIVDREDALAAWRGLMIKHNLHTALEFDTVAFNFEAEKRLYQKLQSVVEAHYEPIQTLIDLRTEEWQSVCTAATSRCVTLLSECALLKIEQQASEDSTAELQQQVRNAEQTCLNDLLKLFSFSSQDVELAQIPLSNGAWESDLFSLDTLKMFGLDARSSAIKGAAAGAGLDLMVGGLSLGVATTIGAIAGAGYSTAKRHGKNIAAIFNQDDYICLDDASIELLFLRQHDLLSRLMQRGHAAQDSLKVGDQKVMSTPQEWKTVLKGLRTGQLGRSENNHAFNKAQILLADLFRRHN